MSPVHEEGFAISDLYMPNYHFVSFYKFLKDSFTKENIEKMLATIKSHDYFPLILTEGGRYVLEDNVLKEILIASYEILILLVTMTEEYWYILSKKPNKKEIDWYRLVVGNKRATDFLTRIEDNRALFSHNSNNQGAKRNTDPQMLLQILSNYGNWGKIDSSGNLTIHSCILKQKSSKQTTQKSVENEILRSYELSEILANCEKIKTQKLLLNKKYEPFLKSLEKKFFKKS
jgi:hypothetical protein